MKIKKFENKWTMGMLIWSAILFVFYLLVFINPQFVISIAEIPAIVNFGNFIDSHIGSYYFFTFITSFISIYFYCCACCRITKLNVKESLLVVTDILIMFAVKKLIPEYYSNIGMTLMVIVPTLICLIEKTKDSKCIYSITTCFSIHYLSQIAMVKIRNIPAMITYPNSATFTLLLIDGFIWLMILYCYFNNRKEN